MSDPYEVGKIGWLDMTVENAPAVRDFYKAVVGWTSDEVDMDGYSDYVMQAPVSGEAVAGVCHARGSNADLPPGWLIYIMVADVEESAKVAQAQGGKVIIEPRGLAGGRFCVIEDPSGSIAGLYQAKPE